MLALKSKIKHNFTKNYTIKIQVLQCQTAHRMLLTPLEFPRDFLDLPLEQWCTLLACFVTKLYLKEIIWIDTCSFIWLSFKCFVLSFSICRRIYAANNSSFIIEKVTLSVNQLACGNSVWSWKTTTSTTFKFRNEKSTCILSISVSPLYMMNKSGSYF